MKEKKERFEKELTLCDLEKTERLSIKETQHQRATVLQTPGSCSPCSPTPLNAELKEMGLPWRRSDLD